MRTDRLRARASVLALLLLWGPAPDVRAQANSSPEAGVPAGEVRARGDDKKVITGDHTVAAGEEVAELVVVGGNLRVAGRVTGDAVVVGGDLIMEGSGVVEGDAVITGGELVDRGGAVRGEMRVMEEMGAAASEASAAAAEGVRAAREARAEATRETARDRRRDDNDGRFSPIRRGFAGLISTLALGLVLAGIGAALIFYGRPYLETVSDTIRSSMPRAAAVGLASGFLVIPAFVVLVVALAVSIVGIPLLLVAVPMYPLALAAAIAMGLLATAHAIGERTAEQRYDTFDFRYRNSYAYLFTGLGMILSPLVAAHLIGMTPFLGFLGTLLKVVTWIGIWIAATIGFGGVVLSRAGTRRTWITRSRDAMVDDVLFDDPASSGTHV